jgi:hypothetical protein
LPPLKASASPELRRVACSGNKSADAALSAVPHGTLQAYAFNFTAPGPEKLPSDLVKAVMEAPGGSYVIGACGNNPDNGSMSTYRVLIVFLH